MRADLATDAVAGLRAAEDLATVQEIVRTSARRLAGADGATFVLRDVDHCFYADEDAISPLWKGQRFPLTNCISGWAMLHARSVVIGDITGDDRIPIESYRPTFVKSLAMVPVGGEKPVAAIGAYWARRHTATPDQVCALEELAAEAGAALHRIGQADAAPPPPALSADNAAVAGAVGQRPGSPPAGDDHERIARDLHDTVLQRLFAAGLRLQGLAGQSRDPAVADALDEVVAQIDDSIRELRGAIFGLEYGHHRLGGLAGQILGVAAEAARVLRFKPIVVFDGSPELVSEDLHHDVTGALREMLSNVSRHAQASEVTVECRCGPGVRLVVTDNGVGPPDSAGPGSGLPNLAARAQRLGGTFALAPAAGGGTMASWSVPAG
jgi:histidine kinase/GAF domain-containing protein/histidine kinase/DNA gyrase B/HSP90-like ATPase